MIRRKGLGFKVFIFTSLLITLIITVTLGGLYFILPSYYLMQKNRTLDTSASALEISLNGAETEDECAGIIAEFSKINNSDVISYDGRDRFMPELSSPFLMLNGSDGGLIKVRLVERAENIYRLPANQRTAHVSVTTVDSFSSDNRTIRFFSGTPDKPELYIHNNARNVVLTKPIQNGIIGYVTISSTLQPIDEAKTVIVSLIPYLLIIAIAVTLIAAYIFARQLTKPILRISSAAELMREMEPDVLSNVRSSDELGQLSHNLDNLYLSLCKNIQNLQLEMGKVSKLEQSKTDFMRAAGHELKTPIATLNGMVEGMIDNVGAYKNHEKYLCQCKDQIARLHKLVNEILKASQLDNIESCVTPEDINISEIVDETVDMYEILIKKKQLQITKDNFDFVYRTDGHIMRRTLSNLISNAVNYTVPGGRIDIAFSGESPRVLSIENECGNIDEDILPKLFEPFFTLNYSRDKTKSGTGLGLYIIKKNLDAMGLPYKIENTETGVKFSIFF